MWNQSISAHPPGFPHLPQSIACAIHRANTLAGAGVNRFIQAGYRLKETCRPCKFSFATITSIKPCAR